jgi:hypothetical protein
MGSCRCVAQQKQRRHLLLPLLPLLLLLPAAIFAKGGGGHSGGRSATGHSGGRISASAGRTTRGGVRVPPSCRSCYYGSSRRMFYNRVFIFTYLGTRYRCHSCGRRSEYAVDDMEVRLQAISGSVTVQLRDNSGSQAIAAPQYTADSLGVGGTVDKAFGAELGAKVISSWWQWKTEPGRRTALSAESHGFADELAIAVTGVTRPNCTVCEPSATVQFTALFEAPTVSSATATSAAARLHAACVAEALCARCGVPSASAPNGAAAACGNSGSSSSSLSCADECAACAGNSTHSGCSTPTVAGVAQGPYLSNSSCTASSPPTGFTITACDSCVFCSSFLFFFCYVLVRFALSAWAHLVVDSLRRAAPFASFVCRHSATSPRSAPAV